MIPRYPLVNVAPSARPRMGRPAPMPPAVATAPDGPTKAETTLRNVRENYARLSALIGDEAASLAVLQAEESARRERAAAGG